MDLLSDTPCNDSCDRPFFTDFPIPLQDTYHTSSSTGISPLSELTLPNGPASGLHLANLPTTNSAANGRSTSHSPKHPLFAILSFFFCDLVVLLDPLAAARKTSILFFFFLFSFALSAAPTFSFSASSRLLEPLAQLRQKGPPPTFPDVLEGSHLEPCARPRASHATKSGSSFPAETQIACGLRVLRYLFCPRFSRETFSASMLNHRSCNAGCHWRYC